MPYFPRAVELQYKCPGCGKTFQPGTMSCAVAHAPGTCCHQYEDEVLPSPYDPGEVKNFLDKKRRSR